MTSALINSGGAIAAPQAGVPGTGGGPVLMGNLDALRSRGIDLHSFVDRWIARRTDLGPGQPAVTREQVEQAVRSVIGGTRAAASEGVKGVIVEGLHPPELFETLHRLTPSLADGYSPRLIVVQRDELEAMDGLAAMDLRAVLLDPRVTLFLGADAGQRLAEWLTKPEQIRVSMPGHVLRSPMLKAAVTPPAEASLARATAAQTAEHERLRSRVLPYYASMHRARWAERYGAGGALRVLLPISRFSTFVRHSAADLAAALRKLGHEAMVLTEPDDHSKLTTPAYLEAFDSFKPDLVVLINYTRRHMGQAIPPGVPFVCWLQDRMAHLFDPASGAAQGDLDFLMGHLHEDLFTLFGYPRRRRLFAFVPASAERFHDGPIDAAIRSKLACEVGYVSHQSETPERFHARVAPMFASHPQVRKSLEGIVARAGAWLDARDRSTGPAECDHRGLAAESLRECGITSPDPRMLMTIVGSYVIPLLERMHRHRTLAWAAEVCARRGWVLKIYGRGWADHPSLAPHAAGELVHDSGELRAAYQAAAAHLHISLTTNSHQRVFECALSGGLMVRRGPSPDWTIAKTGFMRLAAERPVAAMNADGTAVHQLRAGESGEPGDDPEAYFALRGLPVQRDAAGRAVYSRPLLPQQWTTALEQWPRMPLGMMPDLSFPAARETMFCSREELETRLERAIVDQRWRKDTIEAHRRIALQSCTHEAVARKMLSMIQSEIAQGRPQ